MQIRIRPRESHFFGKREEYLRKKSECEFNDDKLVRSQNSVLFYERRVRLRCLRRQREEREE
jgi:hypothetical protein